MSRGTRFKRYNLCKNKSITNINLHNMYKELMVSKKGPNPSGEGIKAWINDKISRLLLRIMRHMQRK